MGSSSSSSSSTITTGACDEPRIERRGAGLQHRSSEFSSVNELVSQTHLLRWCNGSARMTVYNPVITGCAVLPLQPILLELCRLCLDFLVEDLNQLRFRVRCWVLDIVVAKNAE